MWAAGAHNIIIIYAENAEVINLLLCIHTPDGKRIRFVWYDESAVILLYFHVVVGKYYSAYEKRSLYLITCEERASSDSRKSYQFYARPISDRK